MTMATAFTAKHVQELRQKSGAGMMDAKRALEEAGGDMEKAGELLRAKGIAKAEKRSDRTARCEGDPSKTCGTRTGTIMPAAPLREIRPLPMGRKAWLFCWTEVGAEAVAVIQTLVGSCKLHGLNPFDYFVDVLQSVDVLPCSRVEELTPRNWAAARAKIYKQITTS